MPTLNRRKDPNTPTSHRQGKNNRAFYQSYRWHEYSRQYRKKHRLCVKCLEQGKTVLSQCVDHILSIENGGDMWDSANHQALCNSCHSKKTKEERKPQIATIYIVYGPPCSGKNTYIQQRKRFNDLIIDVDDYFDTKHTYRSQQQASEAFKRRDADIRRHLHQNSTIWIPTTTLKGLLSDVKHTLITIDKTEEQCIEYLHNSTRTDKEWNLNTIKAWFAK